jgi:hypothetical protein
MKHERMLRIEDGVVSIEVEYEDHFIAQMAVEDMEDVGLLELAPPKDFKPKCWFEYNFFSPDENGDTMKFKCFSCNLKEACIYKRE